MGTANKYRHYAAECIRLAKHADPAEKEILLGMAEAWRRLAERVESEHRSDLETE
jgi:hypothetical protein